MLTIGPCEATDARQRTHSRHLASDAIQLKLLHQPQALLVGIGTDAKAVHLTLSLRQPEFLVAKQRRGRPARALRQFLNPTPCSYPPILDPCARPGM